MPVSQPIAVFIGRFQPFHNGHLALLTHALKQAAHVVVVMGSAHQARSPKNPFTWQERAQMIASALQPEDVARVSYLPVRDYYNEPRWRRAIISGVKRIAEQRMPGAAAQVALIGHFKDSSSSYLANFEGWRLVSVERSGAVDATSLRNAYFEHGAPGTEAIPAATPDAMPEAIPKAITSTVPHTTLKFLEDWVRTPSYSAVVAEWRMLKSYQAAWSAAPYAPVFVTVDTVIRCAGHVLLIKRGQAPGLGLYAVPGGFIEQRETTYQSALRELREETGLNLSATSAQAALKANAVFDHPDRSQRGRTITHAYLFDLSDATPPAISAGDDAQSAEWIPINQLLSMEDKFHDDHFHMLDHFFSLLHDE
jgi:bifunctional NMN adenylyltransferase/nudix hydrolase